MRADLYTVKHSDGLTRTKAQVLIAEQKVLLDGRPIQKASEVIDDGEHTLLIIEREKYVSRGGYKLEGAISSFSIDVTNKVCADIGASTGGFTDCLLQNGASRVYCIDCGHGQLSPILQNDRRVKSFEGVNARYLTLDYVDGTPVDLAVMDVSFISQTLILPSLSALIREGGELVTLIKPQFEVGVEAIGKGGIVKDAEASELCRERIISFTEKLGFTLIEVTDSPIKGGDGNREYLAYYRKNT